MITNKVVIAGTGTMGSSLAQVYALGGWDVFLYGRSEKGLNRGLNLIELNQETLISTGIISVEESQKAKSKITMTTDKSCFSDCALVVENIIEEMDKKQEFWSEISELVPDETLLATNTSGLSINEMAKAVKLPYRFMGQHWLNPPHLIPLCEIITGDATDNIYVEKMRKLITDLGKSPVVVKDILGFLANRIQFAVLREAMYLVDNGLATFEDIDTVLKAGLGLRYAALGPFGVIDFGGLDVFDHVNSYLNADLCNAKEGSTLLHKMVEEGKLGVKAGAGFYDYSGDKAEKAIRSRDQLYIDLCKALYFKK